MLGNSVAVTIFLIGLFSASTNLWAHGGRLNSQGCHNDTKAGTVLKSELSQMIL